MTDSASITENEHEATEALRAVVLAFDTIDSTRFVELLKNALCGDFQDHRGC
jgi:hypothetical protein